MWVVWPAAHRLREGLFFISEGLQQKTAPLYGLLTRYHAAALGPADGLAKPRVWFRKSYCFRKGMNWGWNKNDAVTTRRARDQQSIGIS